MLTGMWAVFNVAVTRNAAINIPVYVSLCTFARILLEVDFVELKGIYIFIFTRNWEVILRRG